jgi:hypothetical protein
MRISIILFGLSMLCLSAQAQELTVTNVTKVYPTPEVKPRFNGDMNAFLMKNLRLTPKDAHGKVTAEFLIDTAGRISAVSIKKENPKAALTPLEKEVLRVVKIMPPWIPGRRKDDSLVPVRYSLPIILN